jgi:hypothetical protein
MNLPILTLALRRKRDLLLARQQARQVARLLGFNSREQIHIAATVFEIARNTLQHTRRGSLHFRVVNQLLQVCPTGAGSTLRLEKPLPNESAAVAREDLSWLLPELARLTPLNLFEEMWNQNQELLRLLRDVRELQAEQARAPHNQEWPTAA